MEVKQIYALLNSVTNEVLGKTGLINEDLTGVIDVGTEIFNGNKIDNYVKSLVNHIGKVIFVDRVYQGKTPSLIMDAWEFGSVLEKIAAELPTAQANPEWSLTDGETYSQDVFYKPKVSAKFFNSRVTFEVPLSITEKQVKESFSNLAQLNGFISMLYNSVETAMTVQMDALIMRTLNNMIATTLQADAASFDKAGAPDYSKTATSRAVNLLYLYNQGAAAPLTADKAVKNPEFVRFASYIMGLYTDRLQGISTLFNIGGKARFTPADKLHVVLLADFAKAANVYLYGDTFNDNQVQLPAAETVSYWQGSGESFDFGDVSKIDVKIGEKTTQIDGVIGVMFDRDAVGVSNLEKRVTSNYNAKAEFYNNYFKFEAGYFNDGNENFVVFYVK